MIDAGEQVVIVWSDGEREHVNTWHPYANRMIVPVWIDTKYARVEFERFAQRHDVNFHGPWQSWWAMDSLGMVHEFSFRQIAEERPTPEAYVQ